MSSPVSQLHAYYRDLRDCGAGGSSWPLLAIFVNKLYNPNVSAFSICLRDFLSLLLIKGSMVRKEALGRLDAETAVLSFLIGIKP